ncbi:MAG: hypothetical protein HRU10_12550 [Opitutales bacterium]|nr:hypothetical protein [Opitutales bacterium]
MDFFFSTRTPLARLPFAIRLVIVLLVGTGISYLAFKAGYKFLHFTEVGVFFAIITGSITAWTALVQVIRRLRDLDIHAIFFFVPIYNLFLLVLAFVKPGKLEKPA